jgi:hypothetical protein
MILHNKGLGKTSAKPCKYQTNKESGKPEKSHQGNKRKTNKNKKNGKPKRFHRGNKPRTIKLGYKGTALNANPENTYFGRFCGELEKHCSVPGCIKVGE